MGAVPRFPAPPVNAATTPTKPLQESIPPLDLLREFDVCVGAVLRGTPIDYDTTRTSYVPVPGLSSAAGPCPPDPLCPKPASRTPRNQPAALVRASMFAQAPFLVPQLLRNSKNAATALRKQLRLRVRRCPPISPWDIRQRSHGACGSWVARAGAVSYHLISLPPRRLRELCGRSEPDDTRRHHPSSPPVSRVRWCVG